MTLLKALIALLSLLNLLAATPVSPHHEIHERRGTLHPRWSKKERVESHKLFPMRIGLTQSNLENGYDHLMEV